MKMYEDYMHNGKPTKQLPVVAQSAESDPLEQKDTDSPGTFPTIEKKKGKKAKQQYPPKIESPA